VFVARQKTAKVSSLKVMDAMRDLFKKAGVINQ